MPGCQSLWHAPVVVETASRWRASPQSSDPCWMLAAKCHIGQAGKMQRLYAPQLLFFISMRCPMWAHTALLHCCMGLLCMLPPMLHVVQQLPSTK